MKAKDYWASRGVRTEPNVVPNSPKGLLGRLFTPKVSLGEVERVHLEDFLRRAAQQQIYDQQGNLWPEKDTV